MLASFNHLFLFTPPVILNFTFRHQFHFVMIFDIHKMEIRENHFSINGQRNGENVHSFKLIERDWPLVS